MLLKKTLIFLLLLTTGYYEGFAQVSSYKESLKRLYSFSLNNINVGNNQANDSIISLCKELELQARAKGDDLNTFLIGQILVNASCQKGDNANAIAKTKQIYDEAGKKPSTAGVVLSLQAFGSTYLHSGQYKEAYLAFAEAENEAIGIPDEMLHIRLALQQMYTCLALHSTEEAEHYLNKVIESPLQKGDTLLAVQTLYYKAALSLVKRDQLATAKYLSQLEKDYGFPKELQMLHRMIFAQYYIVIAEYSKANKIIDTLLSGSAKYGNRVGYRNTLWLKANILTLSQKYEQACSLYEHMRELSDSINISRYISSIDTLRVAHKTNQIKLENISANNRFIIQSISLTSFVLLVAVIFFLLLHRKNNQIRKSKEKLFQLTESATQAIQTKSLFLSNMSHDLRTPLNAIVGFSNLLADKEEIDEETKQMCGEYIEQNSKLLLKLFNDILDLSSLNENKMSFLFESCNVTTLCRNVTDSVIKSLKNSDNQLLFEPLIGDLIINTDLVRLQQVLINLLVNSAKFTQGGIIRLTLNINPQNNQEAIFTVEDTGCGIPPEKQPGIFERFEKLNEKKQGAGLGLSICKLIVDRLGGNIWIDSNYTQGARFIFTHPLNIKE